MAPVQPGQLTGLRCLARGCGHAEVWVLTLRDWETQQRILLHCRNGHILAWRPQSGAIASCETALLARSA